VETAELPQRTVAILEEEWRACGETRSDLIASLVRTMSSRDTDLVSVNVIAYALASAGEDGVTELIGLLSHSDFAVRTYAAEGLGSLDNRARWAVPKLARILERSGANWTGFTVMRALGNIGGTEAIAILQSVAARARASEHTDEHLLSAVEAALASALLQQ
jgi:HEAT repeat protein